MEIKRLRVKKRVPGLHGGSQVVQKYNINYDHAEGTVTLEENDRYGFYKHTSTAETEPAEPIEIDDDRITEVKQA